MNYYPFGMTFQQPLPANSANKYLYQGKEWQDDFGLSVYDFHARVYDPAIGKTWQVDPKADKYYSYSPYSWVANNPIILIDPTGMEIDWSELSGKERRTARRALRKHESSGTYKNLYKQLKKSDNRYVIRSRNDENSRTGASFEGNFSTTVDDPDGGEGFTMQNSATEGSFAPDEAGGVITLNFGISDDPNDLGDFAVEEVVHAAQYDNLNQGGGELEGLPATANTEFEAKAIVGQIKSETRRPLWTSVNDRSANNFGVNAFRTSSTEGYKNALNQWHNNLPTSSPYKGRRITNTRPSLLKKLIRN